MMRHIRLLPVFLVAAVALTLAVAPESWAKTIQLETKIIIETNDTAGDAGIQIFLDGEGWDSMQVYDPNGNKILNFRGKGSVGMQGITELFFESAEPSFDEQTLEQLFDLFPEGKYQFEGTTTDGDNLKGTATLTHDLPCGPGFLAPNGDDSVNPNNTVIMWSANPGHLEPVDHSVECVPSDPVTIVGYEVIVEPANGGPPFDITLPATTTSVLVPPAFLKSNTAYNYEVLAIEKSGNQTISEGEFKTD